MPPAVEENYLPRFRIKRKKNESIAQVTVCAQPSVDDEGKQVWIATCRPTLPLCRGQAIVLLAQSKASGLGRLSSISGMTRHWAFFGITGCNGLCRLRVPIPWILLSAIEGHAHTRHYPSLSRDPPPHPEFNYPLITHGNESPYEFVAGPDAETIAAPCRSGEPSL